MKRAWGKLFAPRCAKHLGRLCLRVIGRPVGGPCVGDRSWPVTLGRQKRVGILRDPYPRLEALQGYDVVPDGR